MVSAWLSLDNLNKATHPDGKSFMVALFPRSHDLAHLGCQCESSRFLPADAGTDTSDLVALFQLSGKAQDDLGNMDFALLARSG